MRDGEGVGGGVVLVAAEFWGVGVELQVPRSWRVLEWKVRWFFVEAENDECLRA